MTGSALTPLEEELLQLLRMSAESTELLVTMVADEGGPSLSDAEVLTALERLEHMTLVTRHHWLSHRDPAESAVWWMLSETGQEHVERSD